MGLQFKFFLTYHRQETSFPGLLINLHVSLSNLLAVQLTLINRNIRWSRSPLFHRATVTSRVRRSSPRRAQGNFLSQLVPDCIPRQGLGPGTRLVASKA